MTLLSAGFRFDSRGVCAHVRAPQKPHGTNQEPHRDPQEHPLELGPEPQEYQT